MGFEREKLALLTACLVCLLARHSFALPLEDAVRSSLKTNPDIGVVIENRRAVGYELDQARGGYLPSLDLKAMAGPDYTDNPSTRSRNSGGTQYDIMPHYQSSLTLRQPLYDGGATDAAVERSKGRIVMASRRVRETAEGIALSAIQAYLESLRHRELVKLAESNVAEHEATLEKVQAKAEGGVSTVADVQQAQSRLATALAQLAEAKANLKDADATYARVIGASPEVLLRPVPPLWALPKTVEGATQLALRNNPAVATARAEVETARREFEGSNSSFLPSVDFELSADANRNLDDVRGNDYGASAYVVMRYNLFNGGKDKAKRNELVARIGEARQKYNREMRVTEEQMRIAWNALSSTRDRLKAQRQQVAANDRVRKTYKEQFDLGGRNLLDLLDSENEYFFSKGNLISTEFLEIFSVYRILSYTGTLLSALDVEPPLESRTPYDPVKPEEAVPPEKPVLFKNGVPEPVGVTGSATNEPEAEPVIPDEGAGVTLDPNADLPSDAPELAPSIPGTLSTPPESMLEVPSPTESDTTVAPAFDEPAPSLDMPAPSLDMPPSSPEQAPSGVDKAVPPDGASSELERSTPLDNGADSLADAPLFGLMAPYPDQLPTYAEGGGGIPQTAQKAGQKAPGASGE